MKKTLAALFGAGVVLLAAACGSSDGSGSAEETTTTTATASASAEAGTTGTTVELGKSYEENCEALLPYLDELEGWGQDRAAAAQAVADAQQQLPAWQDLSEEEQADTLRAIENAGKGEC
ncbi:Uncharacterised protein [Rhodococcus gordoniae]|uniref:Lipoprotein n=1 Tax=Rhodococcus gordoniae TaxID=223392 RepID=A0A379M402_9NOCA|nr:MULTISPECIES: hypothetical protein [Rhodococcus]UTT49611.1 hypothetical protein NMQ04_05255 [Rhodococcus gordoniae]SUE17029.1 Uncharacterised protein [Rhodococcus gordoniae]